MYGLVAQLVRAPPCHGGGRGFEPHPGRFYKFSGILAQLGEHLPYKQRVTGSSPVGPIHFLQWGNARIRICFAKRAYDIKESSHFVGPSLIYMPMWLNWQSS